MVTENSTVSKKRKRSRGPFICEFPNCGKKFSRSDHLTRHQVNHTSERFICEFEDCGKEFARIDVKKKHEARHEKRRTNSQIQMNYKRGKSESVFVNSTAVFNKYDSPNELRGSTIAEEKYDNEVSNFNKENNNIIDINGGKLDINEEDTNMNLLMEINTTNNFNISSPPLYNNLNLVLKNQNDNIPINKNCEKDSNSPHSYTTTENQISPHEKSNSSFIPLNNSNTIKEISSSDNRNNTSISVLNNGYYNNIEKSEELFYSTEMLRFLLGNSENVSPSSIINLEQVTNGAFQNNADDQMGRNSISVLEEVFAISPDFPNENCQTEIDTQILFRMIQHIPKLENNPDFTVRKIKWYLELYWSLYHCQYPILHRPSFSTNEASPLLLLSMVMTGASLVKKVTLPSDLIFENPSQLAMDIAVPLRWLIFSCDQAKPPCKSWVLQSLIILESYEIVSSSRSLHERAVIYNGAKIQLLRRSPILGGDPFKSFESDTSRSKHLWNTWIESESMKRAALMSFNLDTIHAVVFGHPINIFSNQIKLSLPCPDDIWEYKNMDRSKAPYSVTETPLFLDALKCLLIGKSVTVDSFGRQIILAGLINLILQMEQNASQRANFGWKTVEKSWKNEISSAIKFWKSQLPEGNCCLTLSSVYYANATTPPLPPSLMPEDTRCKFPVYHAAQIYLRITHYDYIVFAGAPKRMNVPILIEDYNIVVKRIDKWSKSKSGKLSVINALILLFEMLLSPENSVDVVNYYYEPDKDPFIYRPNVIISAILSLWAYAFHVFGPESLFKSPDLRHQLKSGFIPAMEDGSYYLRRIRSELVKKTGITFTSLDHMSSEENNNAMNEYCKVLPQIKGLHHLIGLLRTLETSYLGCGWQVGREYAKLLGNCIRRSAGAKEIFCKDMYDV